MTRRLRTSALAISVALGFAALAAPALAQKYYDNEIVITPPVYSQGSHERGDEVTGRVIVSTRDLNLRYDADVQILQQRIADASRLACAEVTDRIEREGGNPGPDAGITCYRDARHNALREARLMVDYARG